MTLGTSQGGTRVKAEIFSDLNGLEPTQMVFDFTEYFTPKMTF